MIELAILAVFWAFAVMIETDDKINLPPDYTPRERTLESDLARRFEGIK